MTVINSDRDRDAFGYISEWEKPQPYCNGCGEVACYPYVAYAIGRRLIFCSGCCRTLNSGADDFRRVVAIVDFNAGPDRQPKS